MEQKAFSIEEVLETFKNKGLNEDDTNIKPYYASLNDKVGIVIFTERKISFLVPSENENESFKITNYRYNIISKAQLYITNKENNLVFFFHGYKHTLNFPYKKDILEVKAILEEYLAFKLKIEKIEGSSKIFLNDISPEELFYKKDEVKQEQISILKKMRKNLIGGLYKLSKRFPFLVPNLKSIKLLAFYFLISILLLSFLSDKEKLNSFKEKSLFFISYTSNILVISNLKKDFDIIAFKLHQFYVVRKSYPKDFERFLRDEFKPVMAKDPSKDPWGNTIELKIEKDVIRLISYGPDGLKNNLDDIIKSYLKDN